MTDWPTKPLKDLCDPKRSIAYGIVQPGKPTIGGVPIVRVNNFNATGLDLSEVLSVDPAIEKQYSRSRPQASDVLVTLVGSIGQVAIAPKNIGGWNLARAVGLIPTPDHHHAEWIAYSIRNKSAQNFIKQHANTTVQATFNLGDLAKLPVPYPDQDTRKGILEVLSAIDGRIELNRRMNETLAGMAQTIFRDWLVDFGPVRRKAAGATDPQVIMGGLTTDPAQAATLAALFPAALGADGLPVRWNARPLDSIAEFLNGLALQKHPPKPGEPDLPVIKIAELRNGLTERSNRAARTLPQKYIVNDGDFIFSWSGSLMAKVWTEGEGALNQHLFKVSSNAYPQWFYGSWVHHHMPEFQLIAASKATTMGHIQRMHLTAAATVCPPDPTVAAMSAVMQPLWDRMIHNELENRTLAETRDYLLPRLMSGAVRVLPQAEAA
jgi:type I restriction enzyme S subunit